MLNITSRISISRGSSRFIRALKRLHKGSFTQKSWGSIRNSVKNEISSKLFANQGFKCVYCERYLIGLAPEIDHFAHKGDYPQFSFTAVNLFYSCKECNSAGRKGRNSTINVLNARYDNCTFLIVHPYYHDPTIEIIYTDTDRIYFDRDKSTKIGNDTIDFFNWEDLKYTTIRSWGLVNERMNPLTSKKERELIQLSISYKK